MSSIPVPATPAPGVRRPGPSPTPMGGAAPTVTIDPLKLLRKYAWLAVAAAVLGGLMGVGAFYVLRAVAPEYTAEVIFEAFPPKEDAKEDVGTGNEAEMERFMQTQVARMISEQVFERISRDPRLVNEAPSWASNVSKKGQVDSNDAVEELADTLTARMMPGTNFIRLSAIYSKPVEATVLVKLAKDAYLNELRRSHNASTAEMKDAIKAQIDAIEQQIQDLTAQRARIVSDEGVDSISQNQTEAARNLALVVNQLVAVGQEIQALKVTIAKFEEMLKSEAGITYTDLQRVQIEQSPVVAALQQRLRELETTRLSMRQADIQPGHRSMKAVEAEIRATEQTLQETREQELRKLFDGQLDGSRQRLAQFQAQEADLLRQREDLRLQLTDLTRILSDIDDLDERTSNLITSRGQLEEDLRQVIARDTLSTAARISVAQTERIPSRVSFPRMLVTVPAGVFLALSCVGGLIVVREILDQRVKSPADVAMIPKARVLGMVPYASEDPSSPESIETVFRDDPRSILAESFRQLRTPLLKKMQRAGHKSLLVVSGLPGSGASSVTLNLAFACAAAEQRVLVVDANFRRPAVHRAFGQGEAPGLSDVLAGKATLSKVSRKTDAEGVEILPAGSREHRVFERLGSEKMSELLAEAGRDYDLVLIDVSPAVVSGDAMSLANCADASILVVRAMGEKRGMVARLRNELSECRAEMLGVVVNAVRSATGGYMRKNIRTSHAYQAEEDQVGEAA
ncbi:MAG: polysaccharide biosynthesis tyrosine autokinase [Phycisphaerales bacterium]